MHQDNDHYPGRVAAWCGISSFTSPGLPLDYYYDLCRRFRKARMWRRRYVTATKSLRHPCFCRSSSSKRMCKYVLSRPTFITIFQTFFQRTLEVPIVSILLINNLSHSYGCEVDFFASSCDFEFNHETPAITCKWSFQRYSQHSTKIFRTSTISPNCTRTTSQKVSSCCCSTLQGKGCLFEPWFRGHAIISGL